MIWPCQQNVLVDLLHYIIFDILFRSRVIYRFVPKKNLFHLLLLFVYLFIYLFIYFFSFSFLVFFSFLILYISILLAIAME